MSYCRCSTLEEVNREFVRTIKDRIQELNLNRKTVAAMAQIPIRGHAVDFVAVLPPKWK